jgi:hypothetical protein
METKLIYNEESKAWEPYEPYMTIDCKTEKDFQFLQNAIEHYKKRGRWIEVSKAEVPNFTSIIEECSVCGKMVRRHGDVKEPDRYCKHCGARMDLQEVENETD